MNVPAPALLVFCFVLEKKHTFSIYKLSNLGDGDDGVFGGDDDDTVVHRHRHNRPSCAHASANGAQSKNEPKQEKL